MVTWSRRSNAMWKVSGSFRPTTDETRLETQGSMHASCRVVRKSLVVSAWGP